MDYDKVIGSGLRFYSQVYDFFFFALLQIGLQSGLPFSSLKHLYEC